jgi:hypothetical protein
MKLQYCYSNFSSIDQRMSKNAQIEEFSGKKLSNGGDFVVSAPSKGAYFDLERQLISQIRQIKAKNKLF